MSDKCGDKLILAVVSAIVSVLVIDIVLYVYYVYRGSKTSSSEKIEIPSWLDLKPPDWATINLMAPGPEDPDGLTDDDLKCEEGYKYEDGLCYKPCKPGYKGIGPVCWQGPCPLNTKDAGVTCIKTTYERDIGEPLSQCPADRDKIAALCYTKCKEGYGGTDIATCWAGCPTGYKDSNATFCEKGSYGRGVGYPWKFKDKPLPNLDAARDRCQRDNPQGCEKNGLIWYPKCRAGYHAVGCCVCSQDCPADFKDTGATCEKPRYSRGLGTPLVCPPEKERGGALCYNKCNPGYQGVANVCWATCPAGWKDTGTQCEKDSYPRGAGKIPANALWSVASAFF